MIVLPRATIATFKNPRADWGETELLSVIHAESAETIQLDLEVGVRVSLRLRLDASETERLHSLVGDLTAQGSSSGRRSETFEGGRDERLVVRYTNWGDPYDEGARFEVSAGEQEMKVDLTREVLRELHKHLGELVPKLRPQPDDPAPSP